MRYLERIHKLRKENRYNQSFVAKQIGVAQTTYSDYEKGRVRMPIEHIVKLARLYDVDLNYITGASDIINKFPCLENSSETE